jgi:aminoglycoside phosphotransferase (APT) family kinase protein
VEEHAAWTQTEQASLAHGDFDVTPIFQRDGRFTGIIDFGEIRGTDRWYDLGHFRMHDGETGGISLLDWLVEGYRSVTPLPANYERRICFASLLVGVRSLGNHLAKGRHGAPVRHAATAVRHELATLLG